jgi:hypothetical protein
MWGRGKAGQSLQEMGRALGKDHVGKRDRREGGASSRKDAQAGMPVLPNFERADISRGIASGWSIREIAAGGVHGERGSGAAWWAATASSE